MELLPFANPGRFWKGNLHTHSTRSDGTQPPQEVCRLYQQGGYDFIALTDHFLEQYGFPITDTQPYRSAEFTTIIGAELHSGAIENGSVWHIVAAGLPFDFAPPSAEESGAQLAARAMQAGAFVGIAHPHWYTLTAVDVDALGPAHAVEVFNGIAADANDRAESWHIMDLLLDRRQRYFAYAADDAGMAGRGARNLALGYLARGLGESVHDLLTRHLGDADNLTDRLAALREIVDIGAHPARAGSLAGFYERWRHEALVVNQWLQVQAISPTNDAGAIGELERHPAFDVRNPNKLRSLYGAFSLRNNRNFHAADGSGYRFLAERVIERDAENQQVAARLLTPLTRWRKFDAGRQALMKEALGRIRAVADEPRGLSGDVFEVVSKSLGDRESG